MNYLRLAALFLALLFYAPGSFAQSTAARAANKSGVITGRVTVHGKGAPGVTITLRSASFGGQGQDMPQAKTDSEGNYRLSDVPLGSYFVTPAAPVYVAPSGGRITSPNDAVVITGGEMVEGINFELVRGGVVTGRVTDAAGHPVIEQMVSLQNANQARVPGDLIGFMGRGSARTDDRGIYRIYGVQAGRYYVSVGAQQRFSAYSTIMGQQAYRQTFYPDAADTSGATIVEVGEGDEASHIDITAGATVEEYSVTGQVIDKNSNAPVPNVGFTLSVMAGGGDRQRAMGLMTLPVYADGTGQFRIDNVPAGRYMISLAPQTSNGMTGQSSAFDVIDQNVTGVVVQAVSGARLSGVVALDGNQDPGLLAELLQFQVQVFVQGSGNGANAAAMQSTTLNPDGSFQFMGLPAGNVRLSIMTQDSNLLGAFKLLRTELNGVQQTRGIPISSGDQLSGIRLVAAYADGTVEGLVKFQNGTPDAGTRVFARLAPVGQQTRGANLGAAGVDSRGHFLIQNVPAGSYTLTVSVFNQPGRRGPGPRPQQQPPISAQQQVLVNEGQVSNVTVVLDLGQNQTPPATPATP